MVFKIHADRVHIISLLFHLILSQAILTFSGYNSQFFFQVVKLCLSQFDSPRFALAKLSKHGEGGIVSRRRKRRCPYCKAFYFPDPRIKDRQKACKKVECQGARKKENQRKWVNDNPDYFRDRYGNTKEWLNSHPEYLIGYRQTHTEYLKANREAQRQRDRRKKGSRRGLDIQDEILPQTSENINKNQPFTPLDIQDEIRLQAVDIVNILAKLPCLDIQDQIALHCRR